MAAARQPGSGAPGATLSRCRSVLSCLPDLPDSFRCDTCDRAVTREAAVRRETFGDLDPEKW
ncbi:hypothetical protein BRC89_11805 [Halobacteriales archaeon QS_4_70_19]|nr:MAG: hypothetical protein BRC89_11805 [Halobacteriales archaeon QS_4_70_19]